MEYSEEVKLKNMKNQLNTIRINRMKIEKAQNMLTILGLVEKPEVTSEAYITLSEVDSILFNVNEVLSTVLNIYDTYEEDILDMLEEPVPTVEYNLKVYLQNSKNTVRYYYGSTYVFSAPIELKEVYDIEFTRLMNEEPKKTVAEAIESLRGSKNLLEFIFLKDLVEDVVGIEEAVEQEGK